jgi:Membrane protein putatively involved in post-translational modification of the autoinducing quorum-sensing peptide
VTIATISNRIAIYLDNNLASGQDQTEIYSYGLEILLGAFIKLGVILALAWAMNILLTTSIVLITWAAIRCFGGGVHMSTYLKCFILGTTTIVGLGGISQFELGRVTLIVLFIFTLILEIIVCMQWAPGDTEKKPIKDEWVRQQQKKKMALVIIVWGLISLYLIDRDLNIYALAMLLGAISSAFLITPWGYRLLESIDNRTGKEVTSNEVKTT